MSLQKNGGLSILPKIDTGETAAPWCTMSPFWKPGYLCKKSTGPFQKGILSCDESQNTSLWGQKLLSDCLRRLFPFQSQSLRDLFPLQEKIFRPAPPGTTSPAAAGSYMPLLPSGPRQSHFALQKKSRGLQEGSVGWGISTLIYQKSSKMALCLQGKEILFSMPGKIGYRSHVSHLDMYSGCLGADAGIELVLFKKNIPLSISLNNHQLNRRFACFFCRRASCSYGSSSSSRSSCTFRKRAAALSPVMLLPSHEISRL